MPDTEKVIRGLEICQKDGIFCYDKKCPYEKDFPRCVQGLISDALSLIRAQQERIAELEAAQTARVMTLEEAMDAEVAWLELYADPKYGVEPIIQPIIVKYYENGYWQCLVEQDENPDLTLFIEDFKTGFRFWTSRPTDKQREAVKWDD